MASSKINVFLTSFPGLNLPTTATLPVTPSISIAELHQQIEDRLPAGHNSWILTTISNKQLSPYSSAPVSNLLSDNNDDFLSLRLSVPLCGGKGGFGSQLRAAGGRMSSKRKRNQGENNGSNRNLDGRRLRTVTEAKNLAAYLAIKPEMDKKEKEKRRERLEQIVELAERKQEELKTSKKGKVDGQWVEDKEEAEEKTREAVLAAMKSGNYTDNMMSITRQSSGSGSSRSEDDAMAGPSSKDTTPPSDIEKQPSKPQVRKFFGFDDEDDDMSDDEEDEDGDEEMDVEPEVEKEPTPPPAPEHKTRGRGKGKAPAKGKGKGKAKA